MPKISPDRIQLGKRIAEIREVRGLTQTALGKHVGVTRSSVSQWESGLTEPTQENLRAIAVLGGVNFDWLATARGDRFPEGVGDEDREPGIPVKGWVGASDDANYFPVESRMDPAPMISMATPDTIALEIRGTSMGEMLDRWFVYFNENDRRPPSELIGETCVVKLPDDRVLVKKLARSKNGKFDLIANVGEPIRGVDVVWAVRVLHIGRRA